MVTSANWLVGFFFPALQEALTGELRAARVRTTLMVHVGVTFCR
jgi:hypothetical protein